VSSYPLLYGPNGAQLYPTPRESPGKYPRTVPLNRENKKSISQYDHSELLSISAQLACRIPSLRAAIRDKNQWAFSAWLPIYMGEDEKWGEAAEEYLINEVLPNALFRELRQDFTWAMRISGMGLDMHGDDLAINTEDEQHNPKIDIIPSPRIGSGLQGTGFSTSVFNGAFSGARGDGMSIVNEGEYKGCAIYNGMIRRGGRWVAARVLGFDDAGNPYYNDVPLGNLSHFACEMEFMGQGRGLPRISSSILRWIKKEQIDDQLMKALENAARHSVIRKLPPGKDAAMALGNAIHETTVPCTNSDGTTEDRTVFVKYSEDGNVQYIDSDENLEGLDFEIPHPNTEAFAIRVLMECLADLGWSYELLDTASTGRAPTRVVTQKANNSIYERQSIQEIRSIRFFQHAIAKGMENGRIPKNRNGTDPYKWGIGFPASMSIDQGNDVSAALDRLKMGLTNERIEAAKDGHIAKHILRQRKKEYFAKLKAADEAMEFAQGLKHGKEVTFEKHMEFFYQPNPNSTAQPMQQKEDKPTQPPKK
jgi:hypothetical protein